MDLRSLRIPISLFAIVLVTGSASYVIAQPTSPSLPFLGRWKLNAAKSDLQTTRLVFSGTASGDITMTMQGTTQTFRLDGKERPSVLGSTAIWTETGPRSWQTVYRLGNADNNIDRFVLSEDGKTLTMRTEILLPKPSTQTMTFARAEGGPSLLGTWQTQTLQSEDNWLELSSTDGKRISIYWMPFGGGALAPIDGSEVPVTGPPTSVPPGMTTSLRVTGPRSFDMAMKMNGANVVAGQFTLSADGRSMTVDSLYGAAGTAQERSKATYEKQ